MNNKKIVSIASANGWAAVFKDEHIEPLIAWALLDEELEDNGMVPVEGIVMGMDNIPFLVESDPQFVRYLNNAFKA